MAEVGVLCIARNSRCVQQTRPKPEVKTLWLINGCLQQKSIRPSRYEEREENASGMWESTRDTWSLYPAVSGMRMPAADTLSCFAELSRECCREPWVRVLPECDVLLVFTGKSSLCFFRPTRKAWQGFRKQVFFRPSATVSRIGLMESCTCRRGGPAPPATDWPPPHKADPPWERDGWLGRSAFTLTKHTRWFRLHS